MTLFNSPLETGIRSLAILTSLFPKAADLQRLVYLDYLSLHSGDVNGPSSLHAALPLRSGELTVRRQLLEQGLLLMMTRGLVDMNASKEGFLYKASESAAPFLGLLTASYIKDLRVRTEWVADNYGEATLEELHALEKNFFSEWSSSFQHLESIDNVKL